METVMKFYVYEVTEPSGLVMHYSSKAMAVHRAKTTLWSGTGIEPTVDVIGDVSVMVQSKDQTFWVKRIQVFGEE